MVNIFYMPYITRQDSKNNPNALFVFGDNDMRKGYGGLAKELRGEPNAVGIRVKKSPLLQEGAYYTDEEYEQNCKKISDDIQKIVKSVDSGEYGILVFPTNGIGTGLAKMRFYCPNTFFFLNQTLNKSLSIRNVV
jgi:hypothetical protein